jgi:hypothetical protein
MKLPRTGSVLFAAAAAWAATAAPSAFAQLDWRNGAPDWATAEDVAAEKNLRNLCMWVSSRTKSAGASEYRAINSILLAADVDGEIDTEAEASRVQEMWARFEPFLICNSMNFDVADGSVTEYAANLGFDSFMNFVAKYRLGLSHVDLRGMTILDYLRSRLDRTPGSSEMARKFQDYYDALREAGAKHKSELP